MTGKGYRQRKKEFYIKLKETRAKYPCSLLVRYRLFENNESVGAQKYVIIEENADYLQELIDKSKEKGNIAMMKFPISKRSVA